MIDDKRFSEAMNRAAQNGELERVNCNFAGSEGHRLCGWCEKCQLPVFKCGHVLPDKEEE